MNDDTLHSLIASGLQDGIRTRRAMLALTSEIGRAGRLLASALARGNKVLIFGNGGSAADAQHIAAELVGRFVAERRALPALALTVDTSALTAIGNDYGFDKIFARQVEAFGAEGDVAIGITTSGKSPNVLAALEVARARGMSVIGLTGAKGASFADACDACIVVPSRNTARIQELHITVGHLLCEIVDAEIASAGIDVPSTGDVTAKELPLPALLARRERWRADGLTVVWTNGVFDVLHAGHLSSLRAARALGDVLVVGVNADAAVTKAKGPTRPVFPVAERAAMLAALEIVDHVLVFEEPTPSEVLSVLKPDVHCKGADYAPPHGAPIPEAKIVEGYGGRIAFLPLVADRSTTSTLARLGT